MSGGGTSGRMARPAPAPAKTAGAPPRRGASMLLAGLGLALVALKLWLVWAQQTVALSHAGYDDGLYMTLARHLADGDWLGPYDGFTLLKPPGYPLWIAANALTGIPLHLTEHLAYAAACAFFAAALRPRLPAAGWRFAIFVVLLFQPMSFSASTLRYVRDSLYTTQVLVIVGAALGLLLRVERAPRVLAAWSLGLGSALGFAWITRDEGIVLVPALACALALAAVRVWRQRRPGRGWRMAALGAGALPGLAIVGAVAAMNLAHYGSFLVSEFQSRELNDAMGALARVEPATPRRWVIVATETRQRIYPHSPAFMELKPFLDGPRRDVWATMGPVMYAQGKEAERREAASGSLLDGVCQETAEWDEPAMRQEVMTGWFVLALREAVQLTGRYPTAPASLGFQERMAREVNAACDAGALACGPARSSLAPPWRPEYLALTLQRACRGAARLLVLADVGPLASFGTEAQLAPFHRLTHDRIQPPPPAPGTAAPPDAGTNDRPSPGGGRLGLLDALHGVYAAALPALALLGLAAAAGLAAAYPRRRSWPCLEVVLVTGLAIGGRMALLAYMDATAFPYALIALYMLPVYPLVFACLACLLIDGVQALQAQAKLRSSAEGP